VRSQTLHCRGSLSFFSLLFLLHCQENGLSSVLRESSWEMPDQDPVLSAQQVGLPAGRIAEAVSVCTLHAAPIAWRPQKMGGPGCLKLQQFLPNL
jgi:hypothetical protein